MSVRHDILESDSPVSDRRSTSPKKDPRYTTLHKQQKELIGSLKALGVVVRVVADQEEGEKVLGKPLNGKNHVITTTCGQGTPHILLIADKLNKGDSIEKIEAELFREACCGLVRNFSKAKKNRALVKKACECLNPKNPQYDENLASFMSREESGYEDMSPGNKALSIAKTVFEGHYIRKITSPNLVAYLKACLDHCKKGFGTANNPTLKTITREIEKTLRVEKEKSPKKESLILESGPQKVRFLRSKIRRALG